jgi:hypothetical protein
MRPGWKAGGMAELTVHCEVYSQQGRSGVARVVVARRRVVRVVRLRMYILGVVWSVGLGVILAD